MHAYLGLSFLLVFVVTSPVNGNLPDLETLCPYNDFCGSNATKTLNSNETDLVSCCQQCSCAPDCDLFGNCCFGKNQHQYKDVRYPCVAIDEHFNAPRNLLLNGTYDVNYHVINDCPTPYLLTWYPRCSDLQSLKDHVFVSDPVTGRVYQNKHCAMCHGVMNYDEWYLSTDCPEARAGQTWEDWFKHALAFCEFTPIPPDYTYGHQYRCDISKPEDIKQCNYTGAWKTLDTEILTACEYKDPKVNSLFYHDVTSTDTVKYQNPYCKLCNAEDDDDWPDLCKPRLSPFDLLNNRGDEEKIKVLINFASEEATVEKQPMCDPTELWDPFQKLCIPVTCPASSIHVAGKCESMFKRFPDETYDIYFRIDLDQWYMGYYSHAIEMFNFITDKIPNDNCYKCGTRLDYDNNDTLYWVYKIRTQPGCSEDYLISQVKMMIDDPPSNFTSNYTLVPDMYVSKEDLNEGWPQFEKNKCRETGVHLNYQFIDQCPRILLDYIALEEGVSDTMETLNSGTICVDEYFSVMQALSGTSLVKQYYMVLVLVMIITHSVIHM